MFEMLSFIALGAIAGGIWVLCVIVENKIYPELKRMNDLKQKELDNVIKS